VDRKIIEKFKEKQKEAYLAEESLREQKNLDELSSLAAERRSNEN
jgi:flagellar export protein FliJ